MLLLKLCRDTSLINVFCALACTQLGLAQAPPTILQILTQNAVNYLEDTSDVSKFATDAGFITANPARNFGQIVTIDDIAAVNGQPVKGTVVIQARSINLRPTPNPGQAIADTVRTSIQEYTFEILRSDGTPIVTIVTLGLAGGSPPPGAPLGEQQVNAAIIGGTGAFLGPRGQMGLIGMGAPRAASITEDPANRRQRAGGTGTFVLQLIPMSQPQVVTTANGPAVTHSSDFTLVTASQPAAAGETLSLFASGLGPTTPGVDPGTPFPASPLAAVNSPVQVTVNGVSAQVLAAVGFPGAVNGYQMNFQVPREQQKECLRFLSARRGSQRLP